MKQLSNKVKKILTISLVILLISTLAAVLSSAQGNYAGGNFRTYYTGYWPGYIITDDTPVYWHGDVPVFTDSPNGINTGDIEILNHSQGTPEGA